MEMAADHRLRSTVLAGAAVAALVVGGWWWRAEAPVSTRPPTAEPSVGPPVSTELERAMARSLAEASPDARVTVRMDAGTGEITEVQGSPGVSIDPATGMLTSVDGAPGELFFEPDPTGGLPVFNQTVWRERARLTPTHGVTRQAAANGSRYLLQYRCTRPGAMFVDVIGAEFAGPTRIRCDGTIAAAEVRTVGPPVVVTLSTGDTETIDAEAQLVALP
ncbi:hypothetical protein V6V47_10070 [Micromonospora sp. CPCC 205539]|uniref:hypothetical protein n=1 Tax=Micromonospora sp. CPCC 205539 TaxID=3122408 RepID=UPI002FF0ECA4